MLIGLVYGGRGAEEFSNIKAVTGIEKILGRYRVRTRRVYLNSKEFGAHLLVGVDLFFVVDSNCKDYRRRNLLFTYVRKHKIALIVQNQKAFSIAKDKFLTNICLNKVGFNTPPSLLMTPRYKLSKEELRELKHFFTREGLPIVVKDNYGSSSQHLALCFNEEEFVRAFTSLSRYCKKILIEKYIAGKEVTSPFVQLFGIKLVPNALELVYDGHIYDYKLKNVTFRNKLRIPPHLPQKILQRIRQMTFIANEVIGCRFYSRLDMKVQGNRICILEINSEPVLAKNDFLARSAKSMGISYPLFVIGLLANASAFRKYAERDNRALHRFISNGERLIRTLVPYYE